MRIWGYIFVFLNVAAAAGFVYLAVQDWRGRQTITAAGLRHLLVLQGLPFDGPAEFEPEPEGETRFEAELAGGQKTRTVARPLLTSYFTAAGTSTDSKFASNLPVPNQLAELKRVYAIVKATVDQVEGPKAKTDVIAPWLILQPETFEERNELLKLIREENAEELQKRLYARFDRVLNAPRLPDASALAAPAEGDTPEKQAERLKAIAEARAAGTMDQSEREAALTHLLVHLDRDAAWQKRIMMVVGLRRYVKAVADQTLKFHDFSSRVRKEVVDDQDAFLTEYIRLEALARDRTQAGIDIAIAKSKLVDQKVKEEDFVKQRQSQLDDLMARLKAVKAEVDGLVAKQTVVERQLFEAQREVGLTLDEIYRLEAELERRERERFQGR